MTWLAHHGTAGDPHPKDRMKAKCPTNNSYPSRDGVWFLMCFGNYNKYCQLVFETLEMDPKYFTDPELNTLEALANNGRYEEVVAAIQDATKKFDFVELEKRFRENDIPFEKIQTVADVLNDEEAFANDQLRRIKYVKQGPTSEIHRRRRVHRYHASVPSGFYWRSGALSQPPDRL